jgi:hypothetical protein
MGRKKTITFPVQFSGENPSLQGSNAGSASDLMNCSRATSTNSRFVFSNETRSFMDGRIDARLEDLFGLLISVPTLRNSSYKRLLPERGDSRI